MSFENWQHGEFPKPGNPPESKPIGEAGWWQADEEPPVYAQGETGVPAPTDCAAPFDCSAECMDLSWVDQATDETAYVVQASIDGGAWTTVATLAAGSESYQDCDLTEGVSYQFRVRAERNGAYSDWCTAAAVASPVFWSPTTWTPIVGGPRF